MNTDFLSFYAANQMGESATGWSRGFGSHAIRLRNALRLQAKMRPASEIIGEAANRAEETQDGNVVASWNAALRKTDRPMVRNARLQAWSWVTSSILVNRSGGV